MLSRLKLEEELVLLELAALVGPAVVLAPLLVWAVPLVFLLEP